MQIPIFYYLCQYLFATPSTQNNKCLVFYLEALDVLWVHTSRCCLRKIHMNHRSFYTKKNDRWTHRITQFNQIFLTLITISIFAVLFLKIVSRIERTHLWVHYRYISKTNTQFHAQLFLVGSKPVVFGSIFFPFCPFINIEEIIIIKRVARKEKRKKSFSNLFCQTHGKTHKRTFS